MLDKILQDHIPLKVQVARLQGKVKEGRLRFLGRSYVDIGMGIYLLNVFKQ